MAKGLLSWWKGATPGRARYALGPRGRLRGNPLMKAKEVSLGPPLPPGCPPAPALAALDHLKTQQKEQRSCNPCGREGCHGALVTGGNPFRTGEPTLSCKWPRAPCA